MSKDYEILLYSNNNNGAIRKDHRNDADLIHSVKRLSDGEVFTIGDELTFSDRNSSIGKIDKLWESHGQLRCNIENMGQVLCYYDKRNDIKVLKHG